MINIPVEDIVAKIVEKSGLTEEEILKKITTKSEELSGLVSNQGAAHIIANEFGVNLYEQTTGRLKIDKIFGGMRSVETTGRVQRIFDVREFDTGSRQGKVGSVSIGDETGTIRIVFWNDKADEMRVLKEGDIVLVENGYVRENQGRKEVHLNDKSKVVANPQGVEVGEVKEFTSAGRKKITELTGEDQNVELLGTIVQVFDPRFFEVCPQCGKRARPHQDGFACETHQKIEPEYSYVFNAVLDDGSMPNGTIRGVFFRNQAERLLGKTAAEMLVYKEDAAKFEEAKNSLLGEIVKVIGRVNKNEMFDRLEFVAQLVFKDPDPEEELKNLSQENVVQ